MTTTPENKLPQFADVAAAAERIAGLVRRTPVLNDPILDAELGCTMHCKCENLQRTGAFKFRGASNAVALLGERGIGGDIATHSSGNHGSALALAATTAGRQAHIVMPEDSVAAKIRAVRRNGGQVHFCKPNAAARDAGLKVLVDQGCVPVHPYDDADIIAGQGTAALELLEQAGQLEIIMTPVGGGGLISGTAIAAHHSDPGISVIAAEPEGAADTAESFAAGTRVTNHVPDTIADGLRAPVGIMNFALIKQHLDHVLTVSDTEIVDAMVLFWRRLRLLIEPSSATVIAAIQRYPELFAGKRTGVILTGGNVDLGALPFPVRTNER